MSHKDNTPARRPAPFALVAFSEGVGKPLLPIDVVRFLFDRQVPWSGKIFMMMATIGALIYTVFPLDIIPDLIPIIGQIDDLAAWFGVAYAFVRWAKQHTSRRTLPELLRGEKAGAD